MRKVSKHWALHEFARPTAPNFHAGPYWPSLDDESYLETVRITHERWMMVTVSINDLMDHYQDVVMEGLTGPKWATLSSYPNWLEMAGHDAIYLCRRYTGYDPTGIFLDYNDYERATRFHGIPIIA